MTWTAVDFRAVPGGDIKRKCNGRRAPLFELVVTRAIGVELPGGRLRITAEKAAAAAGIQPASVWAELVQMQERGSLDARNLGDGDYEVTVTPAGYALAAEVMGIAVH